MNLSGTHAQLGAVNYRVTELGPWPDEQVRRTVGVMRTRVCEDCDNREFRDWANAITGDGSQESRLQKAYDHVKNAVHFQRDEATGAAIEDLEGDPNQVIEVIIRPIDMKRYVESGYAIGDCDDFSMYLAAILRAAGVKSKFVTVAADDRAPNQYSHVYVAAYPRDMWGDENRVACDTSHGPYLGWEVPNKFGKLTEWDVDGGGGLGGLLFLAGGVAGAMYLWKEFAG